MEADTALSLLKKLDDDTQSKLYVEAFVTDDDTSIRSLLSQHVSPNQSGKGKLPLHIPEPRWLADPSHRTRVVARAIFALVTLRVGEGECKKIDALRFKKYYGYMLKQGRHGTLEEFKKRADAVILHLFDDHIYCDPLWCKPLRIQTTGDDLDDVSSDEESIIQELSDEDEHEKKIISLQIKNGTQRTLRYPD